MKTYLAACKTLNDFIKIEAVDILSACEKAFKHFDESAYNQAKLDCSSELEFHQLYFERIDSNLFIVHINNKKKILVNPI